MCRHSIHQDDCVRNGWGMLNCGAAGYIQMLPKHTISTATGCVAPFSASELSPIGFCGGANRLASGSGSVVNVFAVARQLPGRIEEIEGQAGSHARLSG